MQQRNLKSVREKKILVEYLILTSNSNKFIFCAGSNGAHFLLIPNEKITTLLNQCSLYKLSRLMYMSQSSYFDRIDESGYCLTLFRDSSTLRKEKSKIVWQGSRTPTPTVGSVSYSIKLKDFLAATLRRY